MNIDGSLLVSRLEDGMIRVWDILKTTTSLASLGMEKIFSDAIEALQVSYKKMNPFCVPFAATNMDGWVQRGATIYAEFLGGSFTSDAHHMTEPHPEGTGVVLCIEKAIANSGICRDDVNYINVHATSTQAGDLTKFQALPRCFGQNPEGRGYHVFIDGVQILDVPWNNISLQSFQLHQMR